MVLGGADDAVWRLGLNPRVNLIDDPSFLALRDVSWNSVTFPGTQRRLRGLRFTEYDTEVECWRSVWLVTLEDT